MGDRRDHPEVWRETFCPRASGRVHGLCLAAEWRMVLQHRERQSITSRVCGGSAISWGGQTWQTHTSAVPVWDVVSEVHYPLSSQITKASLPGIFFKNSNWQLFFSVLHCASSPQRFVGVLRVDFVYSTFPHKVNKSESEYVQQWVGWPQALGPPSKQNLSVRFQHVLYSRKFSSAKNFVKCDRQAVRQEFVFVKNRPSLLCSSVVALLLMIHLDVHEYFWPHTCGCEKN